MINNTIQNIINNNIIIIIVIIIKIILKKKNEFKRKVLTFVNTYKSVHYSNNNIIYLSVRILVR